MSKDNKKGAQPNQHIEHPLDSSERKLVSIYKSVKKDEMYLYVSKLTQFRDVPRALIDQFGTPEHVMDLLLTPKKKLARVSIEQVMTELSRSGFFLQMPPEKLDQPPFPQQQRDENEP